MARPELIQEAARQMAVCNACRYCEGYCAVFPAMELRTTFTKSDITFLSNVCFDCRACFYACQYAPPHEFAINVPRIFAEIRAETYADFAWPRVLGRAVGQPRLAAVVASLVSLLAIVGLVSLTAGVGTLASVQVGEGAFYRIIPYAAMVLPALAIVLYGLGVFAVGAVRFWRAMRPGPADILNGRAVMRALQDAFSMRYLKGGGDGCTYPDADFSHARRWLHHLTYYGFILDLASTTLAAIYDHVFGWIAPYPLLSGPVVLGSIGGVMLVLGTGGLLALKVRSDPAPTQRRMFSMDLAFLALLLLTGLTGMALLALRETAAMGTLLAVHLAVVAGLFLTAPYGKFAHVVYRVAALIQNAIEQRRAEGAG